MIGIHYARISKQSQAGRLNKANTLFVGEKEDVTNQVIGSLAEFVEGEYDGEVEFTYPHVGLKVEVKVTRFAKETTK